MNQLIRSFRSIGKGDTAVAGGKGASLGEMTRLLQGYGGQAPARNPVPPGFVVTAHTFDQFITAVGIRADIEAELAKVNVHDTNSVEQASKRIRAMFETAEIPTDISSEILRAFNELQHEFVAVRSSATAEDSSAASWAGELETYLYTTKSPLLEHVKRCWSSLFTPRAIFYRVEQGLHDHPVAVAVVVQAMVASEVSGVCFTVHPVTKDANHLIIEAGWGLGEAIVGGIITPDSYVVDKRDWTIVDSYISEQTVKVVRKPEGGTEEHDVAPEDQERQKFSNAKVLELAKLAVKIEDHSGSPQDIEWAHADGQLYILQSRPITTL